MVSSVVSHLPGALLDIIVGIPYVILSTHKTLTRNRASASASASLPATAPELPPAAAPPPPVPTPPEVVATIAKETVDSAPSSEHEHEAFENGSEADVESNDGAGVSESWVSLHPHPTTASSETITT
jgi:hypothetical protein